MFPSMWIRGAEIDPDGVIVTISGVEKTTLNRPGQGTVTVYLLRCEKATRAVILSAVLARQIASAVGSEETGDWIGKRVVLFPQPLRVAGRDVVGIRAHPVD